MKKFKYIFYAVYLITAVLVIFMSIYIYESLDLFKKIGWYKYFSDLPIMVRNLLFYISFLMLIEFVFGGILRLMQKRKIARLNKEIVSLKARLFDDHEKMMPTETKDPAEDDEQEFTN